MRHSLEPEYRKYVKGYGFLSFAPNLGSKYGKKLADKAANSSFTKYGKKLTDKAVKSEFKKAATEAGKNFAKTASTRALAKSAEATGDLFGNKFADKIT